MNPRSPNEPDITRLLTVADVAFYLQVSIRTVRRLIATKELQAIHVGRAVRISQAVLNAYVTAAARR